MAVLIFTFIMNIKCSVIKMDLSILNEEAGTLSSRLQIFCQYAENCGKIQLTFLVIVLDCTPFLYSTVRRFLSSALLFLGPTISRYFYVLGHLAAGGSHSIT